MELNSQRDFLVSRNSSTPMEQLWQKTQSAIRFKTPILITGQSGSGKSTVATQILNHSCGPGRFIKHNSGLDHISQLIRFIQLPGISGIIFENISKMSLIEQEYLVQILVDLKAKYHLIFVSAQDLKQLVKSGEFNTSLFHSISVFHFRVPSLNERKDELFSLAQHFLLAFGSLYHRPNLEMNAKVKNLLELWDWPGNIKELECTIEKCVLRSNDTSEFEEAIRYEIEGKGQDNLLMTNEIVLNLQENERRLIQKALAISNSNRSHAARLLGINVRTLRNKLKEYGFRQEVLS